MALSTQLGYVGYKVEKVIKYYALGNTIKIMSKKRQKREHRKKQKTIRNQTNKATLDLSPIIPVVPSRCCYQIILLW